MKTTSGSMIRGCIPFMVLMFFAASLPGQICNGNLGVNIFTDGDFGSGRANVLPRDPGIAPGYIYETNPPPNDGFYTITNNTTHWGWFATTWDNIRDNSPDPFGYMMVVNASFEPGLFYEKEVRGLCENTLYQFTADVYNLVNALPPNISFQLDGITQYVSGSIPYNRQWNTYGFTFTTQPGQTSVTLAIRNNAPGGLGNDLALDNISFRACGPEALILPREIANICEDGNPIELTATIQGDQYDDPQLQWQESLDEGITWSDIPGETDMNYLHTQLSAGRYYYRYLLANNTTNLLNSKCRVVSNIKVVNVVPKFYTITDSICQGLSFRLGENELTNSGTYEDSLLTYLGCDSIVTLNLTVVPDPQIAISFDIQDPTCSYLEDGMIDVISVTNGYDPYLISVDGIENTNGSLSNLSAGIYTFSVKDRLGCETDTVVSVVSPPPFMVDLGPDQKIALGDLLNVRPFYSAPVQQIQWNDGDIEICDPDCDELEVLPATSRFFILEATSEAGCLARDTLYVEVEKVEKIHMPNAFTPNGDQINDYFTVFGHVPNIRIVRELSVFSRWGELVFHNVNFPPNEPEEGWNGRDASGRNPGGVYAYMAKVELLDGSVVVKSGSVTVVE